jgi:hypothetical protein
MTRKSTALRPRVRTAAAALGMLVCLGTYAAPAARADAADTRAAGTPLYGLAAPYRPAGPPAAPGVPVGASVFGPLTRPDYLFRGDLRLASGRAPQNESEVPLRNSAPVLRARVRVPLGQERLFVYADMGAADSPLRYQGLLGIRVGQDAHLLGGWRRITYYFSPGRDFDALDFDGPFLALQRAW